MARPPPHGSSTPSWRAASSCRRRPGSSPRTHGPAPSTGSVTTCNPTTRSKALPTRSARCPATTWRSSSTRRASAVQAQVYRMGYYQGLGGRLVLQTDFVAATPQPPAVSNSLGTVSCPWKPTMTLNVTKEWPPGCYLIKLVGNGGQEQFVPLTIRDDTSMASYVFQNSRHHLAGLQPLGQLQPLLRPDRRWRAELRQPGPRRLVRSPLPADVGLGSGRLRRQRAPAAPPPRTARPRPDLLDRRRPARAVRSSC